METVQGTGYKRPVPAFVKTTKPTALQPKPVMPGRTHWKAPAKQQKENEDREKKIPAWLGNVGNWFKQEQPNQGGRYAAGTFPIQKQQATGTGSFLSGGGQFARGGNNGAVYRRTPTIPTGSFLAGDGQYILGPDGVIDRDRDRTISREDMYTGRYMRPEGEPTTTQVDNGGGGGGGAGWWPKRRRGGGGGRNYSGYGGYGSSTYGKTEYPPNMGLFSWNFKG